MSADKDFALKLLLIYSLKVIGGRATNKELKEVIKFLEDK